MQCYNFIKQNRSKFTSTFLAATEAAAHLDGSLEELDGDVVLPLETEAVPCDTPGLPRHAVLQTLIIVTAGLNKSRWKSTSGQFLSMSVKSLASADRATSFCRCHRVVE